MDFNYNGKTIQTSGGIFPSRKDTPMDVRTRVETYADIATIPNPYVTMRIIVKADETNNGEMTEYIVKSLKADSYGVANSVIDEVQKYKEFLGTNGQSVDTNDFATKEELGLKADKTELHSHINKTVLDGITSTNVDKWNNKVDKVEGKTLTTNDYTNEEKQTVASLKATVGDTSSGLVKDVKDLKTNGVSQDNINSAIENYLRDHPVQSGATVEQAAQIQANKTAIQTVNETIGNKTGLPSGDANVIASINRIDRKTTTGNGLTTEQAQHLQTAYEHSQSAHVQASHTHTTSDVTDLNLSNIDAVSLNGKKFSEPMTKEDYEAIDPDPNTIYIINDDSSIISLPDYSSIEANKVLAVNSDGTALVWVNAPTGSGSGLTTEQANQLTAAYNHSQTVHVQTSDIPTKLSQLENDLVLVSDGGKKFKLKVSNDGVLSAEQCEVYADIVISNNTLSVNESSSNTFTVALDKAPTSNQVVSLSVNNNNCTLDKTSLTFTSDNYTNQTVRVTGAHDSNSYEDKSSIITLSSDNVTSKTINVTINNIDVPPSLQSISAVYTQGDTVVYPTTSLDSLKSNLVVTAIYSDNNTITITDYTLSGTLTVGTSTITVTYQDKTTTFDVNVVENPEPVLQSISAVYTQGDNIIYPASPLTALTYNLVVTAIYSDNSTAKINSSDYKLSGTLTIGTSTITVTYQDKTTTFDVNVIEKPSISEFTNEHFMVGQNNEEAVDGYFTVNKLDNNIIGISFKSKEIAMGLSPSTDYDVTLNIIENTMDGEITNSTPPVLYESSDSNFNPVITANYTGETIVTVKTIYEAVFTERVNTSYNLAFSLNTVNATTGYIKFSITMKPHINM